MLKRGIVEKERRHLLPRNKRRIRLGDIFFYSKQATFHTWITSAESRNVPNVYITR